MSHDLSRTTDDRLRHHGSRLIFVGGLLSALALAVLIGSWLIMWNVSAQGTAHGFVTALKAAYDAHRPIPDGKYVTGRFRVLVSHTTGPHSELKVVVFENITGMQLATATQSAAAN